MKADDSDDEQDSESPIFNSFYDACGDQSILKMTKFTGSEFRKLYGIIHTTITPKWNNGRGKRSKHKRMNVLFMSLVVLKIKSSWDQLGHIFQIKISTCIHIMHGFMEKIYEFCVERFVEKYDEKSTMHSMIEENRLFKHFPFGLEAVDVSFQQSNLPYGNMQEDTSYFSRTHKLYDYKVEAEIQQNGFSSTFNSHYPG